MFGKKRLAEADFFPRKWEYTYSKKDTLKTLRLFPTRVGVYRNDKLELNGIHPFSTQVEVSI